jgi:uncharacterized protein (TIGR04255 family)
MALNLPDVEDTQLTHAPLAVVVCQVRYEQNLGVGDGDTGLKIHEDLGGRSGPYPVIEPQQALATQIEVGAAGLAALSSAGFPQRGWRFRSGDKQWTISVMPDHTSLETTSYTSWKGDFRDRIDALLQAISSHVKPVVSERIGLRYVNRLSDESRSTASDWTDAIANELMGPAADSFWSAGLDSSQQQLVLDLGQDTQCTFRQGLIPHDSGTGVNGYLLDFDVYQQIPERFDAQHLMTVLDRFNRAALTLFQKSLTPAFLAYLRDG